MSSHFTNKKLKFAHYLAVGILALFSIVSYLFIRQAIERQQSDADLMELANQQKILSQQIANSAFLLSENHHSTVYNNKLKIAIPFWLSKHQHLQNESINRKKAKNTDMLDVSFQKADYHFIQINKGFQKFLQNNHKDSLNNYLKIILDNEPHYLDAIEKMSILYSKNSEQDIKSLKLMGFIVLFITLITLFLVQLFILKPARENIMGQIKTIDEQSNELSVQNTRLRRQQEQLASVNEQLNSQMEEIQTLQEETKMANSNLQQSVAVIEEQNQKLEEVIQYAEIANQRLNQSISYAKGIQQILLPQSADIQSFFKEHFIIYRPKDTVSGDFYWFLPLSKEVSVFVLADCTGHGVAGAFMSMITSTLLHEIISVRGLENPAKILANLNQSINIILKQKTSGNTDGVDMQICFFEKKDQQVELAYSSSKLSLFYWANGEIQYIKGDKKMIGGLSMRQTEFETYKFSLPIDTVFYLTTDGFIDQNDASRMRFGKKNFIELLEKIAPLPLAEQQNKAEQALNDFQGREMQRDDISLIALRCG